MSSPGVNGIGAIAVAGGALLLYSAIQGKGFSSELRTLLAGGTPSQADEANPIATDYSYTIGGDTTNLNTVSPKSAANIQNMSLAKILASGMGWTGAQWNALTQVIDLESGGSATAENAGSGALGFGQALGHGNANTAGTLGNEYGGYGLTDAQARAANSGVVHWQIVWTLNYIKQTYGTPLKALAHEQAYGWY